MLIGRCEPPTSGRGSRRASTQTGREVRLSFTPEGAGRPTRLPSSARSQPGPRRRRAPLPRHALGRAAPSARGTVSRRLDRKRIWGTLALVEVARTPRRRRPTDPPANARRSSRPGTSALASSRPTGAISSASSSSTRATTCPAPLSSVRPLNPTRVPDAIALRFRASGKQGYGVSPGWRAGASSAWTREGITGRIGSCRRSRTRRTPTRRARSGASPDAPSDESPPGSSGRSVARTPRHADAELAWRVAEEAERARPSRASPSTSACPMYVEPARRCGCSPARRGGRCGCASGRGRRPCTCPSSSSSRPCPPASSA